MTIKTLEHIHFLLKEDVEAERMAAEKLKIVRDGTYNSETDSYDPEAEKAYEAARGHYIDAMHALEDFEDNEW